MRKTLKSVVSVTVLGIALALAGSSQEAGAQVVVTPPAVVVSPPVVIGAVPDFYVWDGSEFVGMVGSQYYYLGPGNVWMVMDPPRFHRFQTWERGNPNWRSHATRNTRYRTSAHFPPPSTRSAGPPPQHPSSNGRTAPQNQGSRSNQGQSSQNQRSQNQRSQNQPGQNQRSQNQPGQNQGNRNHNSPPQ